ncbi:MAG: hypothetical protein KF891_01355 [Rhizobacter sp.]|nr:hypothetical protein [Rhizobacter sp.]
MKTLQARGPDGSDITHELMRLADIAGLERNVPGRYSVLLLMGLWAGLQCGQLNLEKVRIEIEALEGLRQSSLKPPSQFKHPPLQGLWHKHYLQSGLAPIARNLRKGLGRYGMPHVERKVAEALASGEERFFSDQDLALIAHDVAIGNWERLVRDSALTGEWLIFAEREGTNYYLCLGRHTSGDESLRAQIDAVCLKEFPFLSGILRTG